MQRVITDPASRARADRFHSDAEKLRQSDEGLSATKANAVVPKEVFFGNVRIAPATILAPMAGVTATVFRRFIKYSSFSEGHDGAGSATASACGLIMTEFTSADGIYRCRESKRKRYLHFYPEEHPISAQLFGSDPAILAEAAKIVEECGFDLVDLNLGCPAKKVVKCNGGSGLLRDLPHIKKIFEAVRAAVKIPFTVKFRMGWDDNEIVCVELAKLAEDCGLAAVALHARTREQGYSGTARWEWIAAVKDAAKIPVIGNGDIRSPEDASLMVANTGCDAVMIGRTAPSNPWIFRQIAQYKASLHATGVGTYEHPTEQDRYQMMRKYFEMLINEEFVGAGGKMKQFASWFTHGIPGGAILRKAIYEAKNDRAIIDCVDAFFAARQNGAALPDDSSTAHATLESMPMAECG